MIPIVVTLLLVGILFVVVQIQLELDDRDNRKGRPK